MIPAPQRIDLAKAPTLGSIPHVPVPAGGRSIEEARIASAPGGPQAQADAAVQAQIDEAAQTGEQMTPEALVDIAQSVESQAMRVSAAWQGVKRTAPVTELALFDKAERAELLGSAPYAVPYVQKFLSNAQLVGMILFCGSLLTISAVKFAALKEEKKRQKEEDADPSKTRELARAPLAQPLDAPKFTPARPPTAAPIQDGNGPVRANTQPGIAGGGLPPTRLKMT